MNEYKLVITNSFGDSIDLWSDPDVVVTSISGVSIDAEVNTMDLGGAADGSSYLSSQVKEREISLVLQYRQSIGTSEAAKLRVYRIFRPKTQLNIRYISPNQDKYINGYVSKCDTPPTTFPMVTQIIIKAPDPYWRTFDNNQTLLCGISPAFEFINHSTEFNRVEFSITKNSFLTGISYNGDAESGITAVYEILSPVSMLGLRNVGHNQTLKINADFREGDILTICTIPKHKKVTLQRDAEKFDYLVNMTPGSRFPLLYPGENIIEVLISGGTVASINVTGSYETLFGGV